MENLNGVKEPKRGRIQLAHRDSAKYYLATSPVRNSTAHSGQPLAVLLRIQHIRFQETGFAPFSCKEGDRVVGEPSIRANGGLSGASPRKRWM